jgi:hypothetical protein
MFGLKKYFKKPISRVRLSNLNEEKQKNSKKGAYHEREKV